MSWIMVDSRPGEPLADLGLRAGFCLNLARSAGEIARAGFARQCANGSFRMKGPQDFLTETDAEVEAHVRSALADAFPADGFLGEETGGSVRDAGTWVVDPIDGTANFARGIPHWCVAIAFVANGATEIGAIYNPSLDEMHFARRGEGVTRNGAPVTVAPTADFSAASFELGWSNRVPNAPYVAALGAVLDNGGNVRRAASGALGLAWVADGRSDGYAELHMNAWDCVAGLLMVREAGGRVGAFPGAGGLVGGGPVFAAAPGVAAEFSVATGLGLEG
jgi:myo-inositol-1(or 4)-monophosphatase